MKNLGLLTIAAALTMTVACNQSGKTKTAASDDVKTEAQHEHMAAAVDGDATPVCHTQTKIYWKGTKPGGEHNGYVMLQKGGSFVVEDGAVVGGEFTIDMNSIVNLDLTDEGYNEKLVGHLKSADFFDVDSFPTAQFVITAVEPVEEGEYDSSIKGDLTMKGVTHPIAFKAAVSVSEDGKVSAKSEEFVIDRTKWNVQYGSKSIFKDLKDKFIDDEMYLMIDVVSM